ncbi:MAG TPA: hypothetical protein VMW27_00455 [Thermoanaerobaculia bacterium]|nr:hypothetical protein [Thermoanaerobaculia bacterium]
MRKRMLFLALALTAAAVSLPAHRAEAAGYYCPQCVTYSNGSQCCVSCYCNGSGFPIWCTDNYCPPEGGIE